MQQRRYRPGDVLDDYCPRERRITDHAIVAMIDDDIKQTRCVVCDAEHEYKDGKVPPQRRKKPQAALFAQVLDGLQGPQPPARVPSPADLDDVDLDAEAPGAAVDEMPREPLSVVHVSGNGHDASYPNPVVNDSTPAIATPGDVEGERPPAREEGPWRRQLIRAALPRPEGQQPAPTRPVPEFTIRQPNTTRGHRNGRRRGSGAPQGQGAGPMRFGRGGTGHGQGQGQGHGSGRSRRRRGGKKNP